MIWERRADMVSALGTAFVVGWLSCSGYYSITHLWQAKNQLVKVETTVVPKLQTQIKQDACDKKHLASVAGQGIAAANSDNVAAPDPSEIRGCSKVAPVKPPPVSAIAPK